MSAATASAHPETAAGRRLRELDEAAVRLMCEALSSPLITDGQRALSWAAFYKAKWSKQLAMSSRISRYVREVKAGKCALRPDVAVAAPQSVQPEVQALAAVAPPQVEEVAGPVPAATKPVVATVPMWVNTSTPKAQPADLWAGKHLPALASSAQTRRGQVQQAAGRP